MDSRSNDETQASEYTRINHRPDAPIILHGKVVQEVKDISYLSSKMTSDGDAGSEINVRIFKTGEAGGPLWFGIEEGKKQEAVAVSGNGLMRTRAQRALS